MIDYSNIGKQVIYDKSYDSIENYILGTIIGCYIGTNETYYTISIGTEGKVEKIFDDSVLEIIDSGGGQSVDVIQLNAIDNVTYTAPIGKAYSPVNVNVPWLMQGPNPVENLGVIYEEETALKDTDYATWTPSTTQTTIEQFANAQPFTIDLQNYEYTLLSQFDFTGVYAENTEQKILTYRLIYVNLANIYLKPANKTDIIANNFNTTTNQSVQSVAFTFYMDSNGVDSLYNGAASAIWPSFLTPSISGNTVTPRTMNVFAKCDTSRFSTASAAAIDQEKSKFKMRCTLFRTPIGGTMRQMYEALTDLYNNPIVITQNQIPQSNILSLNMIDDNEDNQELTRGLNIEENNEEQQEEQPKKKSIFKRFMSLFTDVDDE